MSEKSEGREEMGVDIVWDVGDEVIDLRFE